MKYIIALTVDLAQKSLAVAIIGGLLWYVVPRIMIPVQFFHAMTGSAEVPTKSDKEKSSPAVAEAGRPETKRWLDKDGQPTYTDADLDFELFDTGRKTFEIQMAEQKYRNAGTQEFDQKNPGNFMYVSMDEDLKCPSPSEREKGISDVNGKPVPREVTIRLKKASPSWRGTFEVPGHAKGKFVLHLMTGGRKVFRFADLDPNCRYLVDEKAWREYHEKRVRARVPDFDKQQKAKKAMEKKHIWEGMHESGYGWSKKRKAWIPFKEG